jgi:hypothetical protein
MKMLSLVLGISIPFGMASAQLTIDASGPIRERHNPASSGSGGSSGFKLPVQVSVRTNGAPPDEKGRTVVEFEVTNVGKNDLAIPISPHPGDFEPEVSNVSYRVKTLELFLTRDTGEGANRQQVMLPGGAGLYGNTSVPGTLVSLAPGESIRVLARVTLPTGEENRGVIVGRVTLNDETVKTLGGQTSSDTREIGMGESPDYPIRSLLAPHE